MARLTVNIYGLDEILGILDTNRIKKAVKLDVAQAVTNLHSALATAVKATYPARNDLNKQLVRANSNATFGKNLLQTGLEYKIQYSDMSKFPTTWQWGNIKPNARNKGRVHTTTTRVGNPRVVKGRVGNGGFILRGKGGNPIRYARGFQMVERTTSKHTPLHLLLAPSTATMIYHVINNDKNVQKAIDTLHSHILDTYFS